MAESTQLAGPEFRIREATIDDVQAMTECFFRSFNQKFWLYFLPDTERNRKWWDDSWAMGLKNPTDRSFVVEDTNAGNKVVAFSRWVVPQADGNLERNSYAEVPEEWDKEVAGAFFGGMEENRHALMGSRPHWMLEMLGVHEDYQKHGIAGRLLKWGTDQADKDGLDTYLDGSEVGQPYYIRRHGFTKADKAIDIPDRPQYGSFRYKSLVRGPQSTSA